MASGYIYSLSFWKMISKNQVNRKTIFTVKNALLLKSNNNILERDQWIRKHSIFTQKVKIF